MKLKLTAAYILSFLCLTFLIHEAHDWVHALAARLLGGCWGPRTFDNWAFCEMSGPSYGMTILATLAGPLVNFVLIWIAWDRMDERSSPDQQSFGLALTFAVLPFSMILAALRGGGDLTTCIRLLFPHTDKSNHHLLSSIGLLIILLINVPPLLRAFSILPPWRGRLMFFPLMLILPGFLDHYLLTGLFDKLLIKNGVSERDCYFWVLGWGLLVFLGWFFTRKSLYKLLTEDELPI